MIERVPFTVAVEGLADERVAERLLETFGGSCARVLPSRDRREGKSWLDRNVSGIIAAGEHVPVLVIRDLDRDGCVVTLRDRLVPAPMRFASLRIAVHALEAWLLADRDAIADALGVRIARVPQLSDAVADPKRALVDLARGGTKRGICDMVVPRDGAGTVVGAQYTLFVSDFVATAWSPARARLVSPSLDRACRAIERVVADYRAHIADTA